MAGSASSFSGGAGGRFSTATWALLAGLVLLLAVLGIWGAWAVFIGPPPAAMAPIAAAAVLVAAATLPFVDRVRRMALATIRECLRDRMTLVFAVVLAGLLGGLPFVMTGDGTLAGRIRSLLLWGPSVVVLVTGAYTLVVAAMVVSRDVARRTVFLTVTKPIDRWQYLLGRWAGVVIVGGAMGILAMVGVFGLAQYLRREPPANSLDRREVETEVLAARAKIMPEMANIEREVNRRLEAFRTERPEDFERAMMELVIRTGSKPAAVESLKQTLRYEVLGEVKSRGFGEVFTWRFDGIEMQRRAIPGQAEVLRAPGPDGRLVLRPMGDLQARVLSGSPLSIGKLRGVVLGLRSGQALVELGERDANTRTAMGIRKGQVVDVVADPIIQVSYKLNLAEATLEDVDTLWLLRSPDNKAMASFARSDPRRKRRTFPAPARLVDDQGALIVECRNETRGRMIIDPEDVYVLYTVGGFGMNFARATVLMAMPVLYLAALGVLAGTFLTFRVALLVSVSLLPFSMARPFLSKALRLPGPLEDGANVYEIFLHYSKVLGHYLFQVLGMLLPDLGQAFPGDALADGLHISWQHLAGALAGQVGVVVVFQLLLAWLIFRHRELAQVQV